MTTEDAAPEMAEPIVTHYLAGLDDAVDHLRAANLLGFGVRLSSYLASAEDESFTERWMLEVLAESPLRSDEEDDEPVEES